MKVAQIKLKNFIALAYDGNVRALADDLKVDRSVVYRWLQGRAIKYDDMSLLLKLGLDITWFVDQENHDMGQMFASNEKGQKLKEKFLEQVANSK